MEYNNLDSLINQYPNVGNYQPKIDGDITLRGLYEENFLDFTIPLIDDIEVVENTSFRFILAVKETSVSDETRFFTSPEFYADLEVSKIDSNPYFLQTALDDGLFVSINLDKQIELFNQLKLIDYGTGVKMNQNLFLLQDNSVDYFTLVQYIDWLVSRVDPLDNDNNGIIPSEKIADFEIGKYDRNTGEFISLQDQAVSLQTRLDNLNLELDEINSALEAMSSDLPQEPKKRKTSALEVISLGLGALSVAQGAAAAIKGGTAAFGAAASVTKKASAVKNFQPIERVQIKPIPSIAQPAIKPPNFTNLFPNANIPVQATKTVGSVAKSAVQSGKKILNTVKNTVTNTTKTVSQAALSTAKFVTRQAGSAIGRAVIGKAVQATAARAGKSNEIANTLDPAEARKKQTEIVLKSVAKSAAVTVGKTLAKQAARKLAGAAVGKILGAATGPIGAGVMAAIGIVKFFVNKSKQKKEFEKQKKEYDKVMGEFNRLLKRKEDIEAEIAGILNSGKLKLAREFDERFSSTQRYFANIGVGVLLAQQNNTQPAGG